MIDKERRTEAEPLANYGDCEKRDAPVRVDVRDVCSCLALVAPATPITVITIGPVGVAVIPIGPVVGPIPVIWTIAAVVVLSDLLVRLSRYGGTIQSERRHGGVGPARARK